MLYTYIIVNAVQNPLEEAKAYAKAKGMDFVEFPPKLPTSVVVEGAFAAAAALETSTEKEVRNPTATLFGGEELVFEGS